MGWRTKRYGPVVVTVWPGATSTVALVKRFSRKTRKIIAKPRAEITLAAHDTLDGIADQ